MIQRLTTLIGCVCVAALGVVAVAPAAEAGWLPPVAISATVAHVSAPPHVVLDSAGNATAVWSLEDQVESAYRPAGEGWEAPLDISNPELPGEPVAAPGNGRAPSIGVDGAGDVTVVWEAGVGGTVVIEAVERPAGGAWSAPVTIGEEPAASDPEPRVAVDTAGDAVAVWKKGEVIQSDYRPANESWEAPIAVSGPESFVPQVAMNAAGDATVVWMAHRGGRYVIKSAFQPAGGEWEAPTLVSAPGEEGGDPRISLDAVGDTLVAWRGEDEGSEYVRTAYRPAGESWEAPVDVSAPGEAIQGVLGAVDPDGDAIVTWSATGHQSGEYVYVRSAFQPSGGAWEAAEQLTAPEGNDYVEDLVFDQSGNAALVTERETTAARWVIEAAYRPVGGPWEASVELTSADDYSFDPAVVLDAPGDATAADGDATAVWITETRHICAESKGPFEKEMECGTEAVEAAGYDPEGLADVELEAPPIAEVGEPVSITMSRENLFAPRIDFGDGSSAGVTQATHTYDEPGEYEVSGSGNEVLGYTATSAQTIKVVGEGEGPGVPEMPSPESGSEVGAQTSKTEPSTNAGIATGDVIVPSAQPDASPSVEATTQTTGPGVPRVAHACVSARSALRRDRARLERAGSKAHLRAVVKSARKRVAASC